MKIVYCIDSIHGIGGIQNVTIEKAGALAALSGNDVWIITADNSGRAIYPISPHVLHIDLGINYYEDDWKSRWNVLKGVFIKRRRHRNALAPVLKNIQPDIVISVGQSEKNFLPTISGDWVTIREFHYPRKYRRLHANSIFDWISAFCGDVLDLFMMKKYDGIVSLTHEDKEQNWRHWKNLFVIPNPVRLPSIFSNLESKRIVAVGRLAYPKHFASLIRAFSSVINRFPTWSLDIYGEGNERDDLLAEIQSLGLSSSVRLMGGVSGVQSILAEYSLYAMSSRFEGFPLVLIEALSCGLPVVSYACPCGPKDIIRDGIDGFLVTPGDETMLADRICKLIEDESLRKKMGVAALERSKDFSIDKIIPKWMSLFGELMEKKKRKTSRNG